jgi:SAM-dependent methyltransferase
MPPMPSEIRNLVNVAKHGVRSVGRGRFAEARAAVAVLGLRILEAAPEVARARGVTCAFCGWSGRRFKTFLAGASFRRGAVCPRCLSLERHREFIALFRRVRPLLGARIRLLDIAPTLAFRELCRQAPDIEYVSLDRQSEIATLRGDLQCLPFRPGVFDLVLCSHVLDYVQDDRRGMREIHRALVDGGMAILEQSYRTDRPTEEWDRPRPEELDRVRRYGRDYPDRLRDAGFHLRRAGMGTQPVFLAFKRPDNPLIERIEAAVAR